MGLTSIKLYFVFQQNICSTQPYYCFIKKRQSSWTHQQIAKILLISTPAAYSCTQNDIFKPSGARDWSLHSS